VVIEYPIVVAMWERELIRYRLRAAGVHIVGEGPHPTNPAAWVFTVHAAEGAGAPSVTRAGPGRARSAAALVNWRVLVSALCILCIVGGIGYFAYALWGGADLSGPTVPDARSLSQSVRDWWGDVSAPWEPQPEGEPVVERTGFRWPWESAVVNAPKNADATEWSWPPKNPVGDAIDGAANVITWLVWALVIGGVLWAASLVAGIVRRLP